MVTPMPREGFQDMCASLHLSTVNAKSDPRVQAAQKNIGEVSAAQCSEYIRSLGCCGFPPSAQPKMLLCRVRFRLKTFVRHNSCSRRAQLTLRLQVFEAAFTSDAIDDAVEGFTDDSWKPCGLCM